MSFWHSNSYRWGAALGTAWLADRFSEFGFWLEDRAVWFHEVAADHLWGRACDLHDKAFEEWTNLPERVRFGPRWESYRLSLQMSLRPKPDKFSEEIRAMIARVTGWNLF